MEETVSRAGRETQTGRVGVAPAAVEDQVREVDETHARKHLKVGFHVFRYTRLSDVNEPSTKLLSHVGGKLKCS